MELHYTRKRDEFLANGGTMIDWVDRRKLRRKNPSLVVAWIKAAHDKVCPTITLTE